MKNIRLVFLSEKFHIFTDRSKAVPLLQSFVHVLVVSYVVFVLSFLISPPSFSLNIFLFPI